jgi:hypothetical protein
VRTFVKRAFPLYNRWQCESWNCYFTLKDDFISICSHDRHISILLRSINIGDLWWHDVQKKFNVNPSVGSKVQK